ncbi:hypothetical protein CDL12_01944 [Handroanthus impetiginosus]|uniref:Uncharacterized protein n=1 Tax=Handroanthus impetiginosus TaxID=429701 RepID=A0A2G9I6C7_9LAMI|nr:hypothetical protein CDL12_01944 [Handroanthus impetiginosus]
MATDAFDNLIKSNFCFNGSKISKAHFTECKSENGKEKSQLSENGKDKRQLLLNGRKRNTQYTFPSANPNFQLYELSLKKF